MYGYPELSLEQEVIRKCTAVPNGGDLAYEVSAYGELVNLVSKGDFPCKRELSKIFSHLKYIKSAYDLIYFDKLHRQPVNPLLLEQKAWCLLSPLVEKHLDEGIKIINEYSDDKMQNRDYQKRFERFIQDGISLFTNKWRVLIMSYKVKEQGIDDEIPKWKEKLKLLIKELSEDRPTSENL